MNTTIMEVGGARPFDLRRASVLVAALAMIATALGLVTASPAKASTNEINLALSGAVTGASVLYDLYDFSGQANQNVRVDLVRDGESFARSTQSVPLDSAGDSGFTGISVPTNAPLGVNAYRLKVYSSASVLLATSDPITVSSGGNRVTNPGDHASGTESVSVQQGGLWTFNGTSFTANGDLEATATVAGVPNTVLDGVGQNGSGEWDLDASGNTQGIVRVKVPASTPTGSFAITFSDGTKTVTRTLTVTAAVAATVTVNSSTASTVTISGTGWTHPTAAAGSVIAIKIDDGAYSHVDSHYATHPQPGVGGNIANQSVWYAIQADSSGNFSNVVIQLPDGSGAGTGSTWVSSTGSFNPSASHTLRLLSGNLYQPSPTDTSRTVESAAF
ncbi:MAG: hypothetical protein QM621_09965 [Aeromicrobium sp.]|uniref:hypothetical protein n=1 Tax=Aeromicrobium sp. TaxID=1871063 RepID=UPI0039E5C0A9